MKAGTKHHGKQTISRTATDIDHGITMLSPKAGVGAWKRCYPPPAIVGVKMRNEMTYQLGFSTGGVTSSHLHRVAHEGKKSPEWLDQR